MKVRHLLRRLFASEEICIAPGVYDLVTAKIAETAGFQLMIATGAPIVEWMRQQGGPRSLDTCTSWPQVFLEQVSLICETVKVPVILDGQSLYSTPRALQDSARQLEPCGLAGIILGDGSAEIQEQTLRALIAARHDSGFVVIASAPLCAPATCPDAVQCIKAYRSVGADAVLLRGTGSMDELQSVPQQVVDLPLLVEIGGKRDTPLISAYELQNLGYSIAYWQSLAMSASTQAIWGALRELKTLGKGRRPCSTETD